MTKKRRMFDIDLPEAEAAVETPAPPEPQRRGPMATAITETGEATRQRAEVEAAFRSENDTLAHEFVRLKKLGLITDMIPVDDIRVTKLVRDRSRRQNPELGDLMASLRAIGLSNPIRVEPAEGGKYELVEGWRRLTAYRTLLQETGDARWSRIPASLVPPGETVEGLYRRMVDENLVRKDISWSEMARLARAYAEDQVGGCEDLDQAVNVLFASANPQKRSYIRRFALLLSRLEKHLEHPEAIPRALGLALAHRLEVQPELVTRIVAALRREPHRTAEVEVRLLQAFDEGEPVEISPRGNLTRGRPAKRGKTVLRLPLAVGEVKCTAAPGKVELQLHRDFSTVERGRLEAAIEAFFRVLG
jgi:ParB family transcriptional regulator, chromosome partitioning protein